MWHIFQVYTCLVGFYAYYVLGIEVMDVIIYRYGDHIVMHTRDLPVCLAHTGWLVTAYLLACRQGDSSTEWTTWLGFHTRSFRELYGV